MPRLSLIFYIISIICFGSCASNYIKTSVEEGGFTYIYYLDADNNKQGDQIVNHPDGYTTEKSEYKNNQLHGKRYLFFANGKIEIEETYVEGSLEGIYKAYYLQGQLKYVTNYTDNVLGGLFTQYYKNGNKKEEVTFQDNEENGPFIEYYANGRKKWEGTYRNGDNEVGLLLKYSDTGELIRKLMCDDNSVCSTIWTLNSEGEN